MNLAMSSITIPPQVAESKPTLLALPTEVILSILYFLNSEGKEQFAKCSRKCYFIAFRVRFSGVRLAWRTSVYGYLKPFSDGEMLSSFREYIRSTSIAVIDIGQLLTLIPLLTQFPNITKIYIKVMNTYLFDKPLYLALFPLLNTTLPFYHNITELRLHWEGGYRQHYRKGDPEDACIEATGYIPPTNGMPIRSNNTILPQNLPAATFEQLNDPEGYYNFRLGLHTLPQREFLGPYIPLAEFVKRVATEVHLPKSLKSLRLDINNPEICLLPLIDSTAVDTLHLTDITRITPNLTNPSEILQFHTIKSLTLDSKSKSYTRYLQTIASQFPNVEIFKLKRWSCKKWDLNGIPNFRALRELKCTWSTCMRGEWDGVSSFEGQLKERFGRGEWRELRKVRLFGVTATVKGYFDVWLGCRVRRRVGGVVFKWDSCFKKCS
ncbi:hypothetical protein TWF506_004637 [Arthrobotrys conoides]|uniref:F-box domain-containing protein n=1 Tax=Arthrobotrys conoides TaxID=74498 RepID=A0AAN8RP21_9PEZI